MHPVLHSWREELTVTLVRLLAYLGTLALLSIAAAYSFQSMAVMDVMKPVHRSDWIAIGRPFPAFALPLPEAGDVPTSYAIRRHDPGGGRKDILAVGEPDSAGPTLQVEIYRPGTEIAGFADATATIAGNAAGMAPADLRREDESLASKFGPLTIVAFETAKGTPRRCLAFVRDFDEPRLQLSGWFCQGDAFVERSTLACALDRLTLLAAGSEPKIGALFAQAELNRSYCGQRDTILAPTPKYRLLWKAWASRAEQRNSGR